MVLQRFPEVRNDAIAKPKSPGLNRRPNAKFDSFDQFSTSGVDVQQCCYTTIVVGISGGAVFFR